MRSQVGGLCKSNGREWAHLCHLLSGASLSSSPPTWGHKRGLFMKEQIEVSRIVDELKRDIEDQILFALFPELYEIVSNKFSSNRVFGNSIEGKIYWIWKLKNDYEKNNSLRSI